MAQVKPKQAGRWMLNDYICAVDIGSSKIAASLSQARAGRIANIFFESAPSKGIKRGVIVDSTALMDSLAKVLKNLKLKSDVSIKTIYTNISGPEIITRHSHAVIPLAERGNKVVTLSDIRKVNEQARMLAANLEEELLHQMPLGYAIDSRGRILNPLGLYSHRLEVDLYLVCAKLSSMQNISRIVNQAGYEIKNLFFSGLATSNIVFSKELREGINVLCDIGSDITELLIFKDGALLDIAILPLGGDDITLELSDKLKISFDLAEDTKRTYGKAGDHSQLEAGKEVLIKKGDIYKPLPQKLICELITARTKFICQTIKEALDKTTDLGKIDNFVTTGRTMLLEGFLEILENTLGVQIKIGRIAAPEIIPLVNADNNLSGQRYLNYITSLGMLCETFKIKYQQNLPIAQAVIQSPLLRLLNKFKEIYEEYF